MRTHRTPYDFVHMYRERKPITIDTFVHEPEEVEVGCGMEERIRKKM